MKIAIVETLTTPVSPEAFFEYVLSVEAFQAFKGYGPIPGITDVVFDRPPTEAGARGVITNSDGSTHREQVALADLPRRWVTAMEGFTSPFRFLVREVRETIDVEPTAEGCHVTRTFEFELTSPLMWPAAVALRWAFRRALWRNHTAMRAALSG